MQKNMKQVDGLDYLILRPNGGGYLSLFWYALTGNQRSKAKFVKTPDHSDQYYDVEDDLKAYNRDHPWLNSFRIFILKILEDLRIPMKYTGLFFDFFLNFLYVNDGFFGLIPRIILANVVMPKRGSASFYSTVGQLDDRFHLYKAWNFVEHLEIMGSGSSGSRQLMDLCMMASKLAYENKEVVKKVVNCNWKMNLVEFKDCWNDFQEQYNTHVFILTDKKKDANLILISFRGTEPFTAENWATDFDYAWFNTTNPYRGKLHMGFVEAMGLGNRHHIHKLQHHVSKHTTSSEEDDHKRSFPKMIDEGAYCYVRQILKDLLSEHENAKFVVTGHSLGGALAILFPTLLALKNETEIMKRLLGIYTFGQPRIGDEDIGNFMKAQLSQPVDRYFRVVYSNDLVPRLPFDDKTFLFKHFGLCVFYDTFYNEKTVPDEPDPNPYVLHYEIFGHLYAVWELIRGLTIGFLSPEYKEGWFRIMFRFMGLFLPGVSDHCSTDYINSVRLAPDFDLQLARR